VTIKVTETKFTISYQLPYEKDSFVIYGYHGDMVYIEGIPFYILDAWLGPLDYVKRPKIRPPQEFTEVLIYNSFSSDSLYDVEFKVRPGYNFFEMDFRGFNAYVFGRYNERTFIWA